jgi:hypothetical protein
MSDFSEDHHKGLLETLTAMMDRTLTFSRDGADRTPEAIEEQTYRAAPSWRWKARSSRP